MPQPASSQRIESATRLLVVEDEKATQQMVARILCHAGYAVETADDGEAALDHCLRNAYDAIVLDLMLPGIDGYEVLRRIRDARVMTPVIILTGLDGDDKYLKGFELGAAAFITKPFEAHQLIDRVRQYTDGAYGS